MVNIAQAGSLVLLSLILVLHFVILLKWIPYDLVWGGRLKSDREMYRFEIISILVNSGCLFVILAQSNILETEIPKRIITFSLWLMAGIFFLNTLGTIISKNKVEKRIFTPISILLVLFSFILAMLN